MIEVVSVVDLRVEFPGVAPAAVKRLAVGRPADGLGAVDLSAGDLGAAALSGAAPTAVGGVSFSLAAGECLAIVGESGSGKTLTARSLLGLTPRNARVTATKLTVAGIDARVLRERDWRRLRGAVTGFVSQDALTALDPLRRIGNEVAEPLQVHERLSKPRQRERVFELLSQVAMPRPRERARQYPHELSGGLRQRALIASAIAAGPALLIADEPTTALDVTVQAQVLDLLAELKASGVALLLISHDLTVVRELADRVAVMKGGLFVETADVETLFTAQTHDYTKALLRASMSIRRVAAAPAGGAAESSAATGRHVAPCAPTGRPVVLSARGLVKEYRRPGGSFHAVDGVSFELLEGSTLGIVGESGSGKSTLARMLLGIEKPDRGEVLLGGEPWSDLPESRRRARRDRIQLIHQNSLDVFNPRFTVSRILAEAVALDGSPRTHRAGRIAELMDAVALPVILLTRRAHELSGGQQQRVAIARALARRPRILVCDEPVSALDVTVQAQVLDLLAGLQRSMGLSMVFISHDLAVVRGLSQQVLVVKDGIVVERGDTEEVFTQPQHSFTRRLLAAVPGEVRAEVPGARPASAALPRAGQRSAHAEEERHEE